MPNGGSRAWSGGTGRGARIMAKVVTIPASAATGVRMAIDLVRNREWGVLGAVAWWGFDIATLWACFHAYGPDPPPFAVIVLAYFVGMLGNALPLPGGIGGVDGGMIGAFAAFGVSSDYAISAVLTYRAFAFWLPTLPGAIAYFQLRRRSPCGAKSTGGQGGDGGGAGVTDGRRRATIQSKVSTESERDPVADIENVIIVGSGPAGYTAALYTARANLRPLVIEGFLWGGLLQQTTEVENYPGFPPGGIQGPELMQKMREQAEDFGTRFITDLATKVELAGEPGGIHRVWVGDDEYQARTVVLAMGAEHKKLGVPGEEELGGAGMSYCATCDAAFFKEHDTIIVGGGDSAMEEAIFLAKFASKVHIVNRRDEFRASKIMLERARAMENIEFLTPYVVEEFHEGGGPLRARRAPAQRRDRRGARAAFGGAFIAIGHEPQSDIVAGQVQTDDEDYVDHRGQVHAHRRAGRVRGGRPGRPHLPPGRDGRGLRLPGGARRRVVPARHAAGTDARGAPRGRSGGGPVGSDQGLGG